MPTRVAPPQRDGEGGVRVAVVIPAYSEAITLPEVIAAAKATPEVDEVVVVSDGSTDATAEVARTHGASCIELEKNVGKGGAIKAGLDWADADIYVFLDADLVGVKPIHVQALVQPVLCGHAEVTITRLNGGRLVTDLASRMAPNLSGQRAMTRRVLEGMVGLEATRFAVEVAMNRYITQYGISVMRVALDITHRTKEEKMGLVRGFIARLKAYWEIIRYVGE